jgi:hydroxybutyrate-dimer hydrolase
MTTTDLRATAGPAVRVPLASLMAAVLLASCSWGDSPAAPPVGPPPDVNLKPSYVGDVSSNHYDGSTDDLLTAGLGATGMASAVPPAISSPPTGAELRRLAIYTNYRALLDMTVAGGYGTYYGPGIAADGSAAPNDGKIAGTEEIAFSDDGTGNVNVTLAVQIPDSFDPHNACIVTATSSGSRGVYGAMSVAEWGLKHGCAVALTDKGTGGAPHDLQNDTVPLIDGTRAARASAAASAVHFSAGLSDADLATFDAATPDRFAFKHAHSRQNPERDWGRYTLQAVEFAYWRLNEKFGTPQPDGTKVRTILGGNTIVIASSASNGGGSAIAAAELDGAHLIDGVAVSEPAIEMPASPGVSVQRGSTVISTFGKTLIDFTTVANLYQACASQSAQVAGTPGVAYVIPSFAANRCATLHAQGLLASTTPATQADEALQALRDYGWEPESDVLHASLAAFEVAPAVAVTFANAYSRASVADNLCGFSYAATTSGGAVTPLVQALLDPMWATGNGVPPAGGVQLVNNLSVGGPARALLSVSASSGLFDFDADGAVCLRNLVTGSDAAALALQAGVDETRRSGNLQGKPAIIVHGRADALLPVNHTSRPYTALNKTVEGAASQLSYIEVTNAQHFDAFIGLPTILPGYDSRYVPLHLYLERALDAMYAHLKNGTPLPPSQVVRTVPRGGVPGLAPALTDANVPAISAAPAAGDAIMMSGTTLVVPE